MTPEATKHAETLAHAVTELLRYAREGASTPSFPFGMDDIVAGIAEVLAWSLDVEDKATPVRGYGAFVPEDTEQPYKLRAALAGWLAINGVEVAL